MLVIRAPGLHKRTGSWMVTKGIFNPSVYIDPQTPTSDEFNFMVQHEACHAQERHALWGVLMLVLLPVVGWVMYLPYRRWCEVRADRSATRIFGVRALEIYCRMRDTKQTTWLGRYLYGADSEERIKRTQKGL